MNLAERWANLLRGLRQEERYRSLSGPAGVDFASNDYLGYAAGRLGAASAVAAARSAGFSPFPGEHGLKPALRADEPARSGASSRLLRGNHPIWEQVETEAARWHHSETALVMTSGYTANEGLLATAIEAGDWVASDALNHASIIDGLKLARAEKFIYYHNDLDHLEKGLREAARARTPGRELFVVTESLFGMEGDASPLAALVSLTERFGAHVIVDEAHATGCFGPEGSGLVDAARLRAKVLATVHTGGKALGVPGAYVCCSKLLKELLVNRCRHFIFTTALPPALGGWWLQALARARTDETGQKALHDNAAFLRAELARKGVAAGGSYFILPVVLGANGAALRAARKLQQAGWDIRAIRPPTVPNGTARLRISVHANHDRDVLQRAAAAVAHVVPVSDTRGRESS
jgi:8-amino-7-oxononanoate synthase